MKYLRILVLGCMFFCCFCVYISGQINREYYFREGRQLLYEKKYTQAIQVFTSILAFDANNAEAYFYRGYIKLELSDYKGAIDDFTLTIEYDPYKSEALYYRAVAYIQIKNYLQSFKDLIAAIEKDDRKPGYFSTRGYLHLEFGDTLGAIADFNAALARDRKFHKAYNYLSMVESARGNYDTARILINKALKYNPENIAYKISKADIYRHAKCYDTAISMYQNILTADSSNTYPYYAMGLCYQQLGKHDSALFAFGQSIALNRNNSVAYYNRGVLLLEMEKHSKAMDDINMLVNLNPNNVYAVYIRGILYASLKQYKQAEADFTTAINIYPLLINGYRKRAACRAIIQNYEGYYADLNIIDSLKQSGIKELKLDDIDYLKSITVFQSDFTTIKAAINSKAQYKQAHTAMLPVFLPAMAGVADSIYSYEISPEILMCNILPELRFYYAPTSFSEIDFSQMHKSNNNYLNALKYTWAFEFDKALHSLDSLINTPAENAMLYFIKSAVYFYKSENLAAIARQNDIGFVGQNHRYDDVQPEIESLLLLAIKQLDLCLHMNPQHAFAYYNRAYYYTRLRNYALALADLQQAITLNPGIGEAYFNTGLINIYKGNTNKGCKFLSTAGELGVIEAYPVLYRYCQ